jgi:hypothetical protein
MFHLLLKNVQPLVCGRTKPATERGLDLGDNPMTELCYRGVTYAYSPRATDNAILSYFKERRLDAARAAFEKELKESAKK